MNGSTISRSDKEYKEQLRDLGGLSIGSHCAYVFTDSSEKQLRLFRLVRESLNDPSAAVLYIAGKQGVKGIRFSLKDYGIDVGGIERLWRIRIADSEEWYLIPGKTPSFKAISTIQNQFSEFVKTEEKHGYYYITIISETDYIVRKGFFKEYRELEAALGKSALLSNGVLVCAYDERELKAAGLTNSSLDLSELHSTMLT